MNGQEEDRQGKASRRLDQWLWFARFVKSRSLAARLCAEGAIVVNGSAVVRANHGLRAGDVVTLPQGPWQRTVEVVALGTRRGPATEAQALFRETACVRRAALTPGWEPVLFVDDND